MIFDLAKRVRTTLQDRNCPIPVVLDSPEKSKATGYLPERIVIEHDLNASDSFDAPYSQNKNPKSHYTHKVAAKATIYARSPKSGATMFEHRERAGDVLHMVLVALRENVQSTKRFWSPKSGSFVVPEDLEGSDTHAGAAYELKFEIERPVLAIDWAGDARPETEVGGVDGVGITNTVRAAFDGGDGDFEQVIP
jgi:hypothetical protein